MVEIPKHLEQKIDTVFWNKCGQMLAEARHRVHKFDKLENVCQDDIVEEVEDANRTVDFVTGDDDKMYDEFSFKAYLTTTNNFVVLQGKRIDKDVRKGR